jgi:hypothetical protein
VTLMTPVASRNGAATMNSIAPNGVAKKSARGLGIQDVANPTIIWAEDFFFLRATLQPPVHDGP